MSEHRREEVALRDRIAKVIFVKEPTDRINMEQAVALADAVVADLRVHRVGTWCPFFDGDNDTHVWPDSEECDGSSHRPLFTADIGGSNAAGDAS